MSSLNISNINKYYNADYIAHYTHLDAAKNILDSKQLLLGLREDSWDVLERASDFYSMDSSTRIPDNFEYLDSPEVFEFSKQHKLLNSIRQICFCKTKRSSGREDLYPDNLSFLHLRMWEEYGDLYKGVCFIFSKRELKEIIKDLEHIHYGNVRYEPINTIARATMNSGFSADRLKEIGAVAYIKEREKIVSKIALLKTRDYADENEFRIMKVFCSEKKEFIEYGNALKAVAYFPHYSTERAKKDYTGEGPGKIEEYKKTQRTVLDDCNKKGIEIIRINNYPFYIETEKDFIEDIRRHIDTIAKL